MEKFEKKTEAILASSHAAPETKSDKKTTTIFLSRKDFFDGLEVRKYDLIETEAFKVINSCKYDHDILKLTVSTGSALKVFEAEKVDEKKFIELANA